MPLVKIKTNFQITIPTNVRQKVALKVGDVLEADVKDNKIVLSPKSVVDREPENVRAIESAKKKRRSKK